MTASHTPPAGKGRKSPRKDRSAVGKPYLWQASLIGGGIGIAVLFASLLLLSYLLTLTRDPAVLCAPGALLAALFSGLAAGAGASFAAKGGKASPASCRLLASFFVLLFFILFSIVYTGDAAMMPPWYPFLIIGLVLGGAVLPGLRRKTDPRRRVHHHG